MDKLVAWANKLEMRFNVNKCGVMHIGDRKQRVQVNGHRSGWSEIRTGVPQGSVLGPLLFTIFIDCVLCEISKLADDTKIANQVNNLNDIRSVQRT